MPLPIDQPKPSTNKAPSGSGKRSQALASPSIQLACSSPNSASSRLATLSVSIPHGFDVQGAIKRQKVLAREDHLASIYNSSGSISLLSLRDATGVKEEDTVGLLSLLGLSETNPLVRTETMVSTQGERIAHIYACTPSPLHGGKA